jgi:UPF0755 protein
VIANRIRAVFILAITGALVFAASAGLMMVYFLPGPILEERNFTIARGEALPQIAERLAEERIIFSPVVFRWMLRLNGMSRNVMAGEYQLDPQMSMQDIADRFVEGDVLQHLVMVPEGLTSYQIVELLNKTSVLSGQVLTIPPEGSLMPETYSVPRGLSRDVLLEQMSAAMKVFMEEQWPLRSVGPVISNPREALILASIIERETGVGEERGIVSSVFVNRLERGMRLQSDPTIIYGLSNGEGFIGRPIRRSEIRKDMPHNTYVIRGLPPTPIANPGKASIVAALNPDASPYLYFVASGDGGHVFSDNLEDHNRNVRIWRSNR